MILKSLIYCSFLLFTGCEFTIRGLHSDYKKLASNDKERVIFISTDKEICSLEKDNNFYAITADHLLSCLEKKDSSIVYFWSAYCQGDACIPLSAALNYCNEYKYQLFIISEFYALNQTRIHNKTNLPIFHINHKYYKTDFANKYKRLFSEKLARVKRLNKKDKYSRFFIFHKDKLVRTEKRLL